ncbi:MAG TPA: serine hydrolase [Lacipirellulaceae bacterium]
MKAILAMAIICLFDVVCSAEPLPRSAPEEQGISSEALLAYVDAADHKIDAMNSLMLVRHGHVVAEGWWAPYGAENRHMLYSLSKSFTSTAVGLAIAEGKLHLDDTVLSFFPEDAPDEVSSNLKAMRVRDLLSMSTGHHDETIKPFSFTSLEPQTKQFLAMPIAHKPGTHFVYNTPATYMCSAIVQKVTGEKVVDYLRPRLFEPLGIENPVWFESPQGVSLGGFGLNVRTEDIAKFGQLYLQKGQWQGKQLVPGAWVEAATTRQTSNGSNPDSDWEQGYGYQFWRCRHGFYRGDGAFGQFCIVMPEYDAVLAITSGVRDMGAVMALAWEHLLPAMQSSPLPANDAAQKKLASKLASLQLPPQTGAASSPLAAQVSGKTYQVNDDTGRIGSIKFDFGDGRATMTVGTASGPEQLECGNGVWQKSRATWIAGPDARAALAPDQAVGASGAWTSDDTYSVKLSLYETPFYLNMKCRFSGDEVVIDSEYNCSFGPTKQPQMTGKHR